MASFDEYFAVKNLRQCPRMSIFLIGYVHVQCTETVNNVVYISVLQLKRKASGLSRPNVRAPACRVTT